MFINANQTKTAHFNLSKTEMRDLRIVCRYCSLPVAAMAARPVKARELIAKHLESAKNETH